MTRSGVVISLDTELAWGVHGFPTSSECSKDGEREREIIQRLLNIFDYYNAGVTWAVVGHLFLEECDGSHPFSPSYNDIENWWDQDPGTDLYDSPARYGKDIINSIIGAEANHEIGTHTFSHIICGRKGCPSSVLRKELQYCKKVAQNWDDITISSLVFPRNEIANLSTVAEEDIKVFRGISPEVELRQNSFAGAYREYLRFITRRPAPVVTPNKITHSLWELPASLYFPYEQNISKKIHQLLPTHPRVLRARKSIDQIKNSGGILHLWAHPHDFTDEMVDQLEQVLEYASNQNMPVFTMSEAIN